MERRPRHLGLMPPWIRGLQQGCSCCRQGRRRVEGENAPSEPFTPSIRSWRGEDTRRYKGFRWLLNSGAAAADSSFGRRHRRRRRRLANANCGFLPPFLRSLGSSLVRRRTLWRAAKEGGRTKGANNRRAKVLNGSPVTPRVSRCESAMIDDEF